MLNLTLKLKMLDFRVLTPCLPVRLRFPGGDEAALNEDLRRRPDVIIRASPERFLLCFLFFS